MLIPPILIAVARIGVAPELSKELESACHMQSLFRPTPASRAERHVMEDHRRGMTDVSPAKLMGIAVLSAVLFFLSLIPLDAIPEIPVDIDQKAFFIPLMLAALLPVRNAIAMPSGS
jgi:hypothetical protein